MSRKEERLQKAHELAKAANKIIDKQPLSTIIASGLEMAEWADQTMLDKVHEWIDEVLCNYIELKQASADTFVEIHSDKLIEDLRKAMEVEVEV